MLSSWEVVCGTVTEGSCCASSQAYHIAQILLNDGKSRNDASGATFLHPGDFSDDGTNF